jgi:RNA polymerase sigma-70 factor (ECF subfamily)
MPDLRPAPVVPIRPPAALGERDDDALMELTAAGHPAAFEVLASRYLGQLGRYAGRFLGDDQAGQEVAQEVLLEAWAQRDRYRGGGRFKVYLLTIARNRCRNRARDLGRRRAAPVQAAVLDEVPALGGEQLDQLLEAERALKVRQATAALPEKLREAVLLRFDQGLSYGEMAQLLGRLEVTVRSRVFLGLRRLRATLGEEAP